MTLLKVLYFAHAWHLVKFGTPLVAQPFEAWRHGPVNRLVYDQLKHLKSKCIDIKLTSFDPNASSFVETPFNFDADTMEFLQNIFDYYSQFHAFKLSDLTHETDSPWEKIWRKAETEAVPGMIIPDEMIKIWFAKSSRRQSLHIKGQSH
ncbi:Panacea domain-containing protein [Beijerinckia sp. L45]|uniref:Panacea domain-containing protein n=1 Tax=Beijerinckia sp. L45 TaxID=1641855 RepID=UPI00131C3C1C|nr:type II toxin-antitoxin system antitoxin SocA domain-containing protein [Beijerinckia sp. L45]